MSIYDEAEAKKQRQDMTITNRNAAAAMAALDLQNKKLHAFDVRLNQLAAGLAQLAAQYNELKQMQMQELIESMGNGPTAKED